MIARKSNYLEEGWGWPVNAKLLNALCLRCDDDDLLGTLKQN